MRTFPFPIAWSVSLLWLLCVGPVAAQNTVTNPGFESGTTDWTAFSATLQNSTPGHSGTNAARVSGRNNSGDGVQQSMVGKLTTGTYYVGSVWVRTSSATSVTVNFQVLQNDARGNRTITIESLQVSNVWTQVIGTFEFDVNGTLTSLLLRVSGPPSGVELFLDDVSLAPLNPGAIENLLANPGLESGLTNWAGRSATILSSPLDHTGTNCVVATNRNTGTWNGVEQDVTGQVQIGRTYFVSAWVRTDRATNDTVKLSFQRNETTLTNFFNVATGQASSNGWTWLSGYYTPQTTGTVTAIKFYVEGPAVGVALYVDDAYVAPATGLRKAVANYPNVRLGAGGVSESEIALGPKLFGAFTDAFHLCSPGNALKFQPLQPESNIWSYAEANMLLDFAQAHGGSSRGHVFVWHNQVPNWATNGSPAQLQNTLFNHIDTVAACYRDRLPYWDVVNEAMADSGGVLRSTLWYDAPGIGYAANGSQYIAESFKRARTNDADCALYYNDYSIETVNTKSTAVYNMLAGFVSTNVPVDGIGFQAHLNGTNFDATSFRSNLQRFHDLGLDLDITELDVRLPVNTNTGYASASDIVGQGDVYFEVLGTALGFSNLKVFQTWGIYDGDTWITGQFPGFGQPLPFDFNLDKKPAYWAMWNALAGQAEKLVVLDNSSGDTTSVVSNSLLSASSSRRLNANAANDFITLQTAVPFKGQWSVKVGVLQTNSGGRFQLAVAPPGSTNFVNVGSSTDTYAASAVAAEFDLGTNTFSAAGDWQFRFTVPSKNGSSSGFALTLDYVRLTPVACEPLFTQPLADRSIPVNTALAPALFIAEDAIACGSLVVTATSSNPSLVPNTNLVIAGGSPYYTLAATPLTNQSGTTTISLVANNGTSSTTNAFALTVGTPQLPPVATNQNIILPEDTSKNLVLTASDPDSTNLTFSIVSGPTNGILGTLNTNSGAVTYSPATNYNGADNFTFRVFDGSLYATGTVSLTITAVNDAPTFTAPAAGANIADYPGVVLNVTNIATDIDLPAQTLTYALLSGSPTNATLNPSSRVLNWRPLVTQADSTNAISVAVADDGTPPLSATNNYTITVGSLSPIFVTGSVLTPGQLNLTVTAAVGPDYAIEASTNLTTWSTLFITNAPASPFIWVNTNTSTMPLEFYRVKAGPPLP